MPAQSDKDTIEWNPNALQELRGETPVEAEPTPAEIASVEASVMESTKAMNALGERTPAEAEQIASLEETMKAPETPDVSEELHPYDRMINEGAARIKAEENSRLNAEEKDRNQRNTSPEAVEAFNYVELPDNVFGGERTKNLSVNNPQGFETALNFKRLANEENQKKILNGTAAAGVSVFASGIGATALGYAGLGSALMIGMLPIAGLGFLGWGGKKIYDSYKEKKAKKDFLAASRKN